MNSRLPMSSSRCSMTMMSCPSMVLMLASSWCDKLLPRRFCRCRVKRSWLNTSPTSSFLFMSSCHKSTSKVVLVPHPFSITQEQRLKTDVAGALVGRGLVHATWWQRNSAHDGCGGPPAAEAAGGFCRASSARKYQRRRYSGTSMPGVQHAPP